MGHHHAHVLAVFLKGERMSRMRPFIVSAILAFGLALPLRAAPAETAAPATTHTAAPSAKPATAASGNTSKQMKDGELDVSITGQRKDKMTVGKLDPPAAFNLEDIQNFPADRLHPVLNNPIAFEEGRDFSNMIDFQDEKIYHPWLPEIART